MDSMQRVKTRMPEACKDLDRTKKRSAAQVYVVPAIIAALVVALSLKAYRIEGDSMSPTLKDGDTVIAMKASPLSTAIFGFDGKIAIAEIDGNETVKRIVAVKDEMVYLKGDNEDASIDSRTYGWVPVSSVVWIVIWPAR